MMLEKINWILLKLHWLVLIGLFFLYKCMPVIGEFIKLVSRSGDSFNSITSIFAGVYFSIIILLLSLPSGTIVKSFSKKAFKDIVFIAVRGFLTSVTYVILSFFYTIYGNNAVLEFFDFVTLVIFITTLLQVSIYYSLMLINDINTSFDKLRDTKLEDDIHFIKSWVQRQD
ncbi:hypothetical protein ACWOA4_05440 [Pediococcus pentosaceus]|uniref:Uncharacterized protein n=2 Tax=Pediococcus pentosaceus TaxID=1255 RepID=A0A6L5A3Z4_PEDPE|nr:hypothetical protein [Pediococcus pentosaceus]KAF0348755.1 hypothetical protein GBO26_09040 [Pediococcus pentosaceus]KAF0415013.1 hypothetical protein GBO79_01450 [Pediococcus pentosaceus]KAF0502694.1 hypothetical protein GBP22_04770 [Pediococcus pentosaceus]MBF7105612.1 hypothetical protein [Pediococcus pentosaceus]MBF7119558.1 hypothetical protein [Pediococcus pentosaceus]